MTSVHSIHCHCHPCPLHPLHPGYLLPALHPLPLRPIPSPFQPLTLCPDLFAVSSLCPCVVKRHKTCCKSQPHVAFCQVLAQLHGVTSDGDVEDEQQEDVPPTSQGKEHRRPHSAGNLADQAAVSSTSTSNSHRSGRPPLAETTANNKLGLKVQCSTHPDLTL